MRIIALLGIVIFSGCASAHRRNLDEVIDCKYQAWTIAGMTDHERRFLDQSCEAIYKMREGRIGP